MHEHEPQKTSGRQKETNERGPVRSHVRDVRFSERRYGQVEMWSPWSIPRYLSASMPQSLDPSILRSGGPEEPEESGPSIRGPTPIVTSDETDVSAKTRRNQCACSSVISHDWPDSQKQIPQPCDEEQGKLRPTAARKPMPAESRSASHSYPFPFPTPQTLDFCTRYQGRTQWDHENAARSNRLGASFGLCVSAFYSFAMFLSFETLCGLQRT